MDGTAVNQHEEKNKKTGAVFSFIVHIGLFVLALLPFLTFPDPPPGQEGILVNLGIPDVGQGEENAPIASSEPEESEPETAPAPVEPEPEPEPEEVEPEVVPEPEPEEVTPPKKTEPVKKEVIKTEDPKALALKKKKAEEAKQKAIADAKKKSEADAKRKADAKKKADADAKRKADAAKKKAEADAKAKAEADAKAKAAADKKKYEDAKNKFGDLFGGGEGDGKGKTGTSGNQGDPGGDPNSNVLEGISTGSGKVGGGLGNRGVVGSPKVTDNSQKTGRVVVRVCVDSTGKVISSKFTQAGSTTTDSRLRLIAEKNALKWTFSKGSMDKQCGTITYDFKVK